MSEDLQHAIEIIRNPVESTKKDVQIAAQHLRDSDDFRKFMEQVYAVVEAYNSPMANYLLSFMEMVEILVMNIYSLKTQNWNQFKESLRLMIPWMQIYDNIHYGKWLVEF